MSGTYFGDPDNFPAAITIPDDGDPKPVASINVALEAHQDMLKYIEARALGVQGFSRLHIPLNTPAQAINFTFLRAGGPATNLAGTRQTANSAGDNVYFAIPTIAIADPPLQIITLRARFRPSSGHGALPNVKPSLALYEQACAPAAGNGTAEALVQSVTDNPGSVAEYEAVRELELNLATPQDIVEDVMYYVRFEGESGSNSQANLLLLELSIGVGPS